MCTISFIPKPNHGFILTSNRDESPGRDTFAPRLYVESGVKLLYPKDAVAGGTWVGVSERKRVVCLMNGGFVPHERKASYAKSRGVVVKDFLIAKNFDQYRKDYDFSQIEPFTAIIVDWAKELQLGTVVWDGMQLHVSQEPLSPQIWSSSPLYPEKLKTKREDWFLGFLRENNSVSADDMLTFHKTGGEGDRNSDLVIDRGFVRTKSITQLVKSREIVAMHYEDLESGKVSASRIDLS